MKPIEAKTVIETIQIVDKFNFAGKCKNAPVLVQNCTYMPLHFKKYAKSPQSKVLRVSLPGYHTQSNPKAIISLAITNNAGGYLTRLTKGGYCLKKPAKCTLITPPLIAPPFYHLSNTKSTIPS